MAERLFREAAAGRHEARSAGSEPGRRDAPVSSRGLGGDRDRCERSCASQARRRGARMGGRRGVDVQRRGVSGHSRRPSDQLGAARSEAPFARAGQTDPRRDQEARRRVWSRSSTAQPRRRSRFSPRRRHSVQQRYCATDADVHGGSSRAARARRGDAPRPRRAATCAPRGATAAYTSSVQQAVSSGATCGEDDCSGRPAAPRWRAPRGSSLR